MRKGSILQALLLPLLLVTFMPFWTLAQQQVVTGQVLSQTDQSPVAGASIIVKGMKTGTSTGLDGKFSIKANEGQELIITGIGITSQDRGCYR